MLHGRSPFKPMPPEAVVATTMVTGARPSGLMNLGRLARRGNAAIALVCDREGALAGRARSHLRLALAPPNIDASDRMPDVSTPLSFFDGPPALEGRRFAAR